MWPPLLRLFDFIGRCRFSVAPRKTLLPIGRVGAVDVLGGFNWQSYRTARVLYPLWGPAPGSPWTPYHCVPLFASLDGFPEDLIWPTAPEDALQIEAHPHLAAAAQGVALGERWVEERVWIILDLPGVQSVPLAMRFVLAGFQPVCTFDHWPHAAGLLSPTKILAQLLRYSSKIAATRTLLTASSPPLWICDRERLGLRPGRPHEFDNRYFLDDSILPGPQALRAAGIQHIICVVPDAHQHPLDDIWAYLQDLKKEGFDQIHGVSLQDPDLVPFDFPAKTIRSPQTKGRFQRASAGGFGQLIPSESSSGG